MPYRYVSNIKKKPDCAESKLPFYMYNVRESKKRGCPFERPRFYIFIIRIFRYLSITFLGFCNMMNNIVVTVQPLSYLFNADSSITVKIVFMKYIQIAEFYFFIFSHSMSLSTYK